MSQPQTPFATQCPLCSQPNQCAMAHGKPAAECWCMHGGVSPAALASLAPQERGQRCICPSCGQVAQAPPDSGKAAPL
ncbi:MAG: cysteine-rich CWC family protein [Giesbergeria sp.]|nr:cysteine-rich CWC family protein [Giesbergeria sp.]